MREVEYQLKKFEKALNRLKEALNADVDQSILIDAVIQRFEFTYEMAWKAIKAVLKYFGERCNSPRSCIKSAYEKGWIEDEEAWLTLLEARNLTSHTYNEAIAKKVFELIQEKVSLFDELLNKLSDLTE